MLGPGTSENGERHELEATLQKSTPATAATVDDWPELGELEPELREVVRLRLFDKLDWDDIAILTECSSRTVRRRYDAAAALLRMRLGTAVLAALLALPREGSAAGLAGSLRTWAAEAGARALPPAARSPALRVAGAAAIFVALPLAVCPRPPPLLGRRDRSQDDRPHRRASSGRGAREDRRAFGSRRAGATSRSGHEDGPRGLRQRESPCLGWGAPRRRRRAPNRRWRGEAGRGDWRGRRLHREGPRRRAPLPPRDALGVHSVSAQDLEPPAPPIVVYLAASPLVRVKVVDREAEAIAGAELKLSYPGETIVASGRSDAEGIVALSPPSWFFTIRPDDSEATPADFLATAEASGFESKQFQITLDDVEGGREALLVHLESCKERGGLVVDPAGNAVPDAEVRWIYRVESATLPGPSGGSSETLSDAEGAFRWHVNPRAGVYFVVASKEGFAPAYVKLDGTSLEGDEPLTLHLAEGHEFRGTIHGEDGAPLPRAIVLLEPRDSELARTSSIDSSSDTTAREACSGR